MSSVTVTLHFENTNSVNAVYEVTVSRIHKDKVRFESGGNGPQSGSLTDVSARFTNLGFKKGDRVTITKSEDDTWVMTHSGNERLLDKIQFVSRDLPPHTMRAISNIDRVLESGSYHYIALTKSPEILIRISSSDFINSKVASGDKVQLKLIDESECTWEMEFLSPPQTPTPSKPALKRGNGCAPGVHFGFGHPAL